MTTTLNIRLFRTFILTLILLPLSFHLSAQMLDAGPNSSQAQSNAQDQSQGESQAETTLKVGVVGSEPFVFNNKHETPDGISIEIWEGIADKRSWLYHYTPFNSIDSALEALNSGSLDVVVGPISITSQRLAKIKFSQPYYQSSLAIAYRAEEPGFWEKIKPIFSMKLFVAVGVFLFILFVVGTLLWFVEHKESPDQFPDDPLKGIGNGMWLAIVTMSTTGYGDLAPITLKGRIVAGTWMVVTLIFATSMVAGIASTLTLSGLGTTAISHIEQLSGKQVATITNSPSVEFLQDHHAKVVETNSLQEAFSQLKSHQVSAVVYDRPLLLYFLKNAKDPDLHLANAEYFKQGYGFAFSNASEKLYPLNRTLLELTEDGKVDRIIDYYLGSKK